MEKKRSPYVGHTEEEVRRMENNYFCVQFGGDFLCEDGTYLFTQNEASRLYKATLNDLLDIVETGNEKDRKYALELISNFVVRPMRLH